MTPHHGAKRRREQEPSTPSIELAFSKLKAHLRRVGATTFDAVIEAIGNICSIFTPEKCLKYLAYAGYGAD